MAPESIAEITAGPGWRAVDLLSDLHLDAAHAATRDAWAGWLRTTEADAVFLLGDLFEAWPGDDVLDGPGFEADCAAVLREAASRRPVFFMHGNRDFLVGPAFARATGLTLLQDPTVLAFGVHRWLLSHGDALCLDDTEYLAFRAQVRSPAWQRELLARPLAERQALARSLRDQSESRKRSGATYADVDTPAAAEWLRAAQAGTLLHGHTHRPAEHHLGDGLRRVVTSDWDLDESPNRGDVLRLTRDGALTRLPVA